MLCWRQCGRRTSWPGLTRRIACLGSACIMQLLQPMTRINGIAGRHGRLLYGYHTYSRTSPSFLALRLGVSFPDLVRWFVKGSLR